jgi:hypothetical protein
VENWRQALPNVTIRQNLSLFCNQGSLQKVIIDSFDSIQVLPPGEFEAAGYHP